jgi:hypothetical protein
VAKVHNQKSMRKLLEENGWTCTLGGNHVVKMVKSGCLAMLERLLLA